MVFSTWSAGLAGWAASGRAVTSSVADRAAIRFMVFPPRVLWRRRYCKPMRLQSGEAGGVFFPYGETYRRSPSYCGARKTVYFAVQHDSPQDGQLVRCFLGRIPDNTRAAAVWHQGIM